MRVSRSMFGGRVAEEMIFGAENVTTGAADDIRRRPSSARRMVTEFGMSREARAAALQRQRGGGVPRPLGDAAQERLRRHRPRDRRGNPPPHRRGRSQGPPDPDRASRRSASLAKALLEYETLSAATRSATVLRGEKVVRARCHAAVPARARDRRRRRLSRRAAPGRAPRRLDPEPQPGHLTRFLAAGPFALRIARGP